METNKPIIIKSNKVKNIEPKRPFNSNIYSERETKDLIQRTMEHLDEKLSRTLGPFGSTTIMEDPFNGHSVTKDGFTVLSKIKYDNEVARTILEMVRKISRSLVREVGDGSTSSIMISNKLFSEINILLKNYNVPPKEILNLLNNFDKFMTEKIKSESIKIDEKNFEKIKDIASISNNNDENAGDIIYNLYEKVGANGFITLESNKLDNDEFKINEGINIDYGYIFNIFANQKNKIDCVLENPHVFLCNDVLDESDLEKICELTTECVTKLGKPLLFVAKGYDTEIQNFFKINKQQQKNKLEICAITYPLHNRNAMETLKDLSIFLNCSIYDKVNETPVEILDAETYLGSCTKAIINDKETKIIGGKYDKEERNARIELLKTELNKIERQDEYRDTSEEVYNLNKRIATLESKIATLFIGGKTELEIESRKYLMEDAIYACQSALKFGYVSGGNLIIPRIIKRSKEDIIKHLIESKACKSIKDEAKLREFIEEFIVCIDLSFRHSFKNVLYNRFKDEEVDLDEIIENCIKNNKIFNLIENDYEDIAETKVINSSMTDIQIMKAAFSIIGLIATSNQFITGSMNIEVQ